jgi:pimeloyl-ACP methyl ester carboxylesterase
VTSSAQAAVEAALVSHETAPVDRGGRVDRVALPDGRLAQLWQGGAPEGPVVFFFHGCPDTRHAARSGDAAARRAGVRLVAVNRPGYGLSDPADSGHVSVADDTAAVADVLGVGRFAVLGMSVGGPYALACAGRYPDRVAAAGIVSAPAVVPDLDPPWPRDDLTPVQQAQFVRLAAGSVCEAVETMRPEFERFVARMAPNDPDDAALARRWTEGMHPQDVHLLSALDTADLAASIREALACSDGYLRDAAVTFRAWEVRPEQVACRTWLWYGDQDPNVSLRNGRWLADHLPHPVLAVREKQAHLGPLIGYWDQILRTLHEASSAS